MADVGGDTAAEPAGDGGVRGCSISLVIPCYSLERSADLLALLESIERQTAPIDELLVVVQKSEPLVALVRQRLTAMQLPEARAIYLDAEPRVTVARNHAVRQARGDVIAFADDDSVLAESWCSETRRFYAEFPEAVGAAGAILPLWDTLSMAWFPRELYWMLSCTYWRSERPEVVRNGYGANMSFRRAAFDNGRLFSETLGISGWGGSGWHGVGGEEPEFASRVTRETGGLIYFVPDIIAWHRVRRYRLALPALARRAYWEGRFKAAFRREGTGSERPLETERQLLAMLPRSGASRLRQFGSTPLLALRQQGVVCFSLACVAAGFVEGTARRTRIRH